MFKLQWELVTVRVKWRLNATVKCFMLRLWFIILCSDVVRPSACRYDSWISHCTNHHVVVWCSCKVHQDHGKKDPNVRLIIRKAFNENLFESNGKRDDDRHVYHKQSEKAAERFRVDEALSCTACPVAPLVYHLRCHHHFLDWLCHISQVRLTLYNLII